MQVTVSLIVEVSANADIHEIEQVMRSEGTDGWVVLALWWMRFRECLRRFRPAEDLSVKFAGRATSPRS